MGGSKGIFSGPNRSPQAVAENLRKEAEESAVRFETDLAQEFSRLLGQFNSRNTEETAERLADIKSKLSDELETTFDTLFGGSVAKHTYVDGISDVDSLLVVSGDLVDASPDAVLNKVEKTLRERLDDNVVVTAGKVAVTVRYPDNSEIQLVPCIRQEGILRVPAWESNNWSAIDPEKFQSALTNRNADCNGKLIPTLKLAKAINFSLPESLRLSGYHIESLGVAAFRGYTEEYTTVRMLPYFFKRASELILKPIVDKTGQSVHVDEYLGGANSEARVSLSHALARIHQRMLNASAAGSRERWLDLLGE
jgi:hypothetical protein